MSKKEQKLLNDTYDEMMKNVKHDYEETTVMIGDVEVVVLFDYLPPERGDRDKNGMQLTPDLPGDIEVCLTAPEGYEDHPDVEQACWDEIEG